MLDLKKIIQFKQLAEENFHIKMGSYKGNMSLIPVKLRPFYKVCNPPGWNKISIFGKYWLYTAQHAIKDTKDFINEISYYERSKDPNSYGIGLSKDMFFFGNDGYGNSLVYHKGIIYDRDHETLKLTKLSNNFIDFLLNGITRQIKISEEEEKEKSHDEYIENQRKYDKQYLSYIKFIKIWIDYSKRMYQLIKNKRFNEASGLKPPVKGNDLVFPFSKVSFFYISNIRKIRTHFKNETVGGWQNKIDLMNSIKSNQLYRINNPESVQSFLYVIRSAMEDYENSIKTYFD